MKKAWVMAAWVSAALFAFLLQPKITVFDFPLNLTLVLVYAFAVITPPLKSDGKSFTDVSAEIRGSAFGSVVGLLEDLMSGLLPGINLLSKGLTGFLSVVIFRDIISQWTPLIGGIAIFVLTLIDGVIVVVVSQLVMNIDISEFAAIQIVFAQAVINLPLGCLLKSGRNTAELNSL
jgi:hypothetical protein